MVCSHFEKDRHENQEKTAKGIVDIIYATVFKYGRSVNWEDDATVVIIKMNGT